MLSRAEIRARGEWLLRSIAIAALIAMLWQTLRAPDEATATSISARGLAARILKRWSGLATAPGRIHVQLDSAPSPVERAWLGALSGAGSRITWSGDLDPLMIDASPVAAPAGGTRVFVSAVAGSPVVLSDEVGAIDTVRAKGIGASFVLKGAGSRLIARGKGATASTVQTDSVTLRKVMVIGSASWESKFVVAALEEAGWRVDAFIRVAPGVDVTQGSSSAIDTSRYSAVVALDSTAAPYAARIAEFVRSGGGLVMEPGAAVLDGMAALRAGNVGNLLSGTATREAGEAVSAATLPFRPIALLREDAVPLENRSGSTSLAARRVHAGRVLQTGYDDTWRWRMNGGDNGVRDHRQWWTDVISKAVYAPAVQRQSSIATGVANSDEAPFAGLVAAIGAATARNPTSTSATSGNWMTLLLALFVLALLGEVASRRFRGLS